MTVITIKSNESYQSNSSAPHLVPNGITMGAVYKAHGSAMINLRILCCMSRAQLKIVPQHTGHNSSSATITVQKEIFIPLSKIDIHIMTF